jgi:hypothetical protein
MLRRQTQGSTSKLDANADKPFCAYGKTKVTRILRIVFFLWLVVSIALILTAISQRPATIELLRTTSSASTLATLTFSAQAWNPWTYSAQSLVWGMPFPDA